MGLLVINILKASAIALLDIKRLNDAGLCTVESKQSLWLEKLITSFEKLYYSARLD